MFKSKCIQHRYLIAFFLFLFAFYGYNIQRVYGFIFFPDEFGYWSYAAKALGYDWSAIVSLGSYYSYGYSLILFPILKIFKSGVMAYRVAITVNFVLLGVDALVLNRILGKLAGTNAKWKDCIPFFTGIALFYPPVLFYAKTSMVETVLMSMFLLIMFFLYHYLENNRLSTLAVLLIITVYIHFLHMRAVGIAIAVLLTIVVYFIRNSKKAKHVILALLIGTVLVLIGFGMKTWLQTMMYGGAAAETIHINDYAGQLVKIRHIFSKEGMTDFICGLCGKILYLGLASFGLVYFGIIKCLREIKIYFRDKKETTKLIYLFFLLSLVGEILINAIYNIYPTRVDSVVYGRYDEFVLPVFMALGVMEVLDCKRIWTKMLCIIPSHALMTYLAIYEIEKYQLTDIHGYFMVGISYLHYLVEYTTKNFFWSTYLFGTLLMFAVLVILRIVEKKKMPFFMVGIILIEFLFFARASQIYLDTSSLGAYRDSIMAEKIEELMQREDDRRIIYLRENDDCVISSIQFLLPDEKIEIVPAKENVEDYTTDEIDANDILLIGYESTYGEKLEGLYRNSMLEGRFRIYYN